MKKPVIICLLAVGLLLSLGGSLLSQSPGRGDFYSRRKGVHSGNKIRTTFFNYGLIGRMNDAEDYGGEWPINSGHFYLGDASVMVGTEIVTADGDTIHSVEVSFGPRGNNEVNPSNPNEFWGWEPLPGYASPDTDQVAMSHLPNTWPPYWPDKLDNPDDPGWPGAWNGYFGKDQFNADQESYFWMDDCSDEEFNFYPDSTDATRRGLGLQVKVRGLQWSQVLAEDCIFWLYEITNVSTTDYDKVAFGMIFGNMMGAPGDYTDDCANFIKEDNITYAYDFDGIGGTGWSPVGYAGYAFLESPGNPYDGIDNDGDGKDGPGPVIDANMFKPKSYIAGDTLVLIDYNTYERTVVTMPEAGVTYWVRGRRVHVNPGDVLKEKGANMEDDNLNGLIDEDSTTHIGMKYKDYITHIWEGNLLINERRDDGIDNDGDWDPELDDVGADGAPGTNDTGEGDGVPTPGEPNFDATDIDESDQIGLTSFYYFHPFNKVKLCNDDQLWKCLSPGYYSIPDQNVDGDFIYGSGYFPLKAGDTQRFSLAMLFGEDLDDIVRNKKAVQIIYNQNYNFATAPYKPTLHAVPGDRKVTLYWDDRAEKSFDRLTRTYDFEGYKIYRATEPGFTDAGTVTDGFGTVTFNVPVAQFDLDNDINGFFPLGFHGVQFYLGDDTGLQHSWVDTTVQNGQTYYYAVTAYDRGLEEKEILPAETAKYATIDQAGRITTDPNVVAVTPNAPAAGYVPPQATEVALVQGKATGKVFMEIVDPREVPDNHTYHICFKDSAFSTQSYTWVDVTDPENPDTLIKDDPHLMAWDEGEIKDGMRLSFQNVWVTDVIHDQTGWNDSTLLDFQVKTRMGFQMPNDFKYPADYEVIFGNVGIDTSIAFTYSHLFVNLNLPAVPVNFKVKNVSDKRFIDFAFLEVKKKDNRVSPRDVILFFEELHGLGFDPQFPDSLSLTWCIEFGKDTTQTLPTSGDTLRIVTSKPFTSADIFKYTTTAAKIDKDQAKAQLDRIKVVPNPYVVAATWERSNPYTSGRGPRELHFNHLPAKCTIRIYTISGELVDVINHESEIDDGTAEWDMMTKDNLDIAYGVYIYYVDAPGIGHKIGKFAVIK